MTGPEVSGTNRGAEEFDSGDEDLVWRRWAAATAASSGGADVFAADAFEGFRAAVAAVAEALEALERIPPFEVATLTAEDARLAERPMRLASRDAAAGMREALGVPGRTEIEDTHGDAFVAVAKQHGTDRHDAR